MYCLERALPVVGVSPKEKLKLSIPGFVLPIKEFKKKYD